MKKVRGRELMGQFLSSVQRLEYLGLRKLALRGSCQCSFSCKFKVYMGWFDTFTHCKNDYHQSKYYLETLVDQGLAEASREADNTLPAQGFQKLRGLSKSRHLRAAVGR